MKYLVRVLEVSDGLEGKLILEDSVDGELRQIISFSNGSGKEHELFAFLAETPLERVEKRLDKLCREFLKLIKQKY